MAVGRSSGGCETGAGDDGCIEDESTRGLVGGRGCGQVIASVSGEGKSEGGKTRGTCKTSKT